MIAVREFSSAEEMIAARRALTARLYAPPAPKPHVNPEPVIRDWLHIATPALTPPTRAQQIIGIVATAFAVRRHDLIGPRKDQIITLPRMVSYYLMHECAGMSFSEIGRSVGERDHTTARSGVQRVKRLMAGNAKFAARIAGLALHCRPRPRL